MDTGYVIEERTVIPWDIRRKYLELAMDLKKMIGLKNVKVELTGKDGKPIDFNDSQRAARLISLLNLAERRKAKDSEAQSETAPESKTVE